MNPLGERIARLIEAQGPLSVAQFMTIALHDPLDGYYSTHQPFGADGDFITAPEISQMFGELLGLWIAQVWHDQGRHTPVRLIELGPGRGTLMADALRAMKRMPEILKALDVVLIEASSSLQKVQAETLKDCDAKLSWATQFSDTLADRPIFVLTNEFFDALPIRQYAKTERGWCERMVVVENGKLAFALAPVPVAGPVVPTTHGEIEDGAIYEVSPAATALSEEIARAIAAKGGAALIVDYGYAEMGFGETLQAMGQHEFRNVLETPGEIDLSAHVNFPALADAARHGGAAVFGPVPQGNFLTDLGIEARVEILSGAKGAQPDDIRSRMDRLVLADQMGLLFKALAILPNTAPTPPGF
ncbi:MAG TPA: SAM-dependent methyltransferase [Rhizomicrobium sp.]|nr:SAM-dependent methyltransferase [Rhizomicrobium sp.]